LRILVVDDEELARLRIVSLLRKQIPDVIIAEAENGFAAIQQVETFVPDLVFLDVEMPGMTGLQFLLHFEARPFKVIFQTAYDEFAVKAFEENAVDYLLKPFSDDRMIKALEKAGVTPAVAGPLEHHLLKNRIFIDKLYIKAGSKRRIVEVGEIESIRSEQHVTRIFLAGIDFAYDHSLSFLEERLDPASFVRVHRNVIVPLDKIASFDLGTKAQVTLKNGEVIAVSRERKKHLATLLKA
jgi:two-component system LytT family response regulator